MTRRAGSGAASFGRYHRSFNISNNAPMLSALEMIGNFYTCANCIGDHWKFEKKESRIISESSTISIQK